MTVKIWIITRLRLFALLFLAQAATLSTWTAVFWILTGRDDQAQEVIMGFDRLGNAGTGGSSLESISHRAGRGQREGMRRWCLLCWVLGKVEKNHCQNAKP